MTIEVTSVAETRRSVLLRLIGGCVNRLVAITFGRPFSRAVLLVLILTSIFGAVLLRRSYNFYAAIIDARLARGYLTSRPGLYAAPTILRPGQGLSADELIAKLRRAGYVEAQISDVWNGSFRRSGSEVEIRASLTNGSTDVSPVRVVFNDRGRIAALLQDDVDIDSFRLEPELLTNDVATKIGEHSTLTYSEIPPILVQAILSIEDHRFFQHPGLDLFGVTRAVLRNAGDERIGQGGSTITQQLVKNTYLSPERTFRRKYAEALLAFALERRLSKEEIFALYCNEIYLGQRGAVTVRGVEQASRIYFGKEVKSLSLAEAAMIAGMIQSPSRYSPVRQANAAQERRKLVLQSMVRDGWINSDQAAAAAAEVLAVVVDPKQNSLAPYFIDYVNHVAESQVAASPDERRVFTTINLDLQELAEAALKRQLDFIQRKSGVRPQAALVALDPHTGDVLAMVGGDDYANSQLNRATDAHRQPGSAFKPFVYAAAIEDGISPVQMFTDAPQEFVYDRNRIYRPVNFGGGFSMRDVTMRSGLVQSLNTVTVAVAMRTGLARISNLAARFGLPKPERYPSLALGTTEVTPLELATAYAGFANGGRRIESNVIAASFKRQSSNEYAYIQSPQVVSMTTAYVITNMLSDVIDHGTAHAARAAMKGVAVAGKTGTSRDGWFVGYTPNLVCAVWIGFDDNRQLGLTGAQAALPAWTDFMKAAISRQPELGGRNFECPEGIKFVEIDSDTGLLSTLTCPHRELIAVTEDLAPHAECYKHGNLTPADAEDQTVTVMFPNAVAKERLAPIRIPPLDHGLLNSTWVDVDSKGRHTLVNVMR